MQTCVLLDWNRFSLAPYGEVGITS